VVRTGTLVDATLIPSASVRQDGEARWAGHRHRKPGRSMLCQSAPGILPFSSPSVLRVFASGCIDDRASQ
jgi:hypothetical protein